MGNKFSRIREICESPKNIRNTKNGENRRDSRNLERQDLPDLQKTNSNSNSHGTDITPPQPRSNSQESIANSISSSFANSIMSVLDTNHVEVDPEARNILLSIISSDHSDNH